MADEPIQDSPKTVEPAQLSAPVEQAVKEIAQDVAASQPPYYQDTWTARFLLISVFALKVATVLYLGIDMFMPMLSHLLPDVGVKYVMYAFMILSTFKDGIYRVCDRLDDGIENQSVKK